MAKISEKQIKEFMDIMNKTRKLMHDAHMSERNIKGSTALQLRGLMVLNQNPGMTVGELASKFMMSSASIAQYLSRLVKAGLIEKRADRKDKRIGRIFLSKLGEKELIKSKEYFFQKMKELLQPISGEELDQMINIHKKLLTNLEEKYENS